MSRSIRDQIKNNAEFQLTSLGRFDLKNVAEAVELFAIANRGFVIPDKYFLKGDKE
jgi:hypothetical protein